MTFTLRLVLHHMQLLCSVARVNHFHVDCHGIALASSFTFLTCCVCLLILLVLDVATVADNS